MKASELIEKLKSTIDGIGDLDVKIAIDSNHGHKVTDIDAYMVVGDSSRGHQIWIEL